MARLACSLGQTRRKNVFLEGDLQAAQWLSFSAREVRASICSEKLVHFLRAGRPPAPPGPYNPLCTSCFSEAKNKSVCTENYSNTAPQHTPSRVPEGTRRKSFRSGVQSTGHRLLCAQLAPLAPSPGPLPRPPPPAHAFCGGSGPTTKKVREAGSVLDLDPNPPSGRDAPEVPRPPGARTPPSDPARPHPACPARLCASLAKVALSLSATRLQGLGLCFLFPRRR